MIKTLALCLHMSLLGVAVHSRIFTDTYEFSGILIFLYSLFFWLAVIGRRKLCNLLWLTTAHFFFWILLLYHQFFQDALSLTTLKLQYGEGLHAAANAPILLVAPTMAKVVLFSLVMVIIVIIKVSFVPLRTSWRLIAAGLLGVLCSANWYYYQSDVFSQAEFNFKARYFGYPSAWQYELTAFADKNQLYDKLNNSNQIKTYDEFNHIGKADNIYVIQAESLDYNAINSGAMPFLQSMTTRGAFYKIRPHDKKSSANSDFFVLTSQAFYNHSFSVIYKLIKPDYYRVHPTIAQRLKDEGYHTAFYHGNIGSFFNRRPHIENMGFDKIAFEEELKQHYSLGSWGVDDQNVADFITQEPRHDKNFYFWITLSMHYDFDLGLKYKHFIAQPQTLREKYLNCANYTDGALQKLFEHAPQDSLFIIYSDHDSETSDNAATVLLLYHKSKDFKQHGEIVVGDVPMIIRQIVLQ